MKVEDYVELITKTFKIKILPINHCTTAAKELTNKKSEEDL